jgi:streptogramin lyase
VPAVIIIASSVMTTTNIEQQQLSYAQINQNLSKSVLKEFPVSPGSHTHDVAPVPKGGIVWYTAQASGKLGWLDPNTAQYTRNSTWSGFGASWCNYRPRR